MGVRLSQVSRGSGALAGAGGAGGAGAGAVALGARLLATCAWTSLE